MLLAAIFCFVIFKILRTFSENWSHRQVRISVKFNNINILYSLFLKWFPDNTRHLRVYITVYVREAASGKSLSQL